MEVCSHIQYMYFVHKILFGKTSKFSITPACFFSDVSESSNGFCFHFLSDRWEVEQNTVYKFLSLSFFETNDLISVQLIHSVLMVCLSVESGLYFVWVLARTTVFSSHSTRAMARCLFTISIFVAFTYPSYSVHYRLHNTNLLLASLCLKE